VAWDSSEDTDTPVSLELTLSIGTNLHYLRIGDPVLESEVLASLERFESHLTTQLRHVDGLNIFDIPGQKRVMAMLRSFIDTLPAVGQSPINELFVFVTPYGLIMRRIGPSSLATTRGGIDDSFDVFLSKSTGSSMPSLPKSALKNVTMVLVR